MTDREIKKDFTDQDVVYMGETILGYLDMGMIYRAKQHLENLQRWFIDLPPEGELAPPEVTNIQPKDENR